MPICAAILEFADSPAKEALDRAAFQLCTRTGTPEFITHITLAGTFDLPLEEMRAKVDQIGRPFKAFDVTLNRWGFGEDWTRSAYLLPEKNPALDAMRDRAEKVLQIESSSFMAHASVLYKDSPLEKRQALAASVDLQLPLTLTIDRLTIWDLKGPLASDIARYETVHTVEPARAAERDLHQPEM